MGEASIGTERAAGERRTLSVRTRITLIAVGAVAVLFGIGAFGTVWMLDRVLTDQIATQLDDDIDSISDDVDDRGGKAVERRDDDLLIAIHTEGGVHLNDDDAAELPGPGSLIRGPFEIVVDGDPMLALAEDTDEGVVVVARSSEHVGDAVRAASAVLSVAALLGVALIGLVVWLVAGRALGPVERIRRQVLQIGSNSLDQRVTRTGRGDEFDRLAGTMNHMLDRVEDGYRARQRFVSDASHELRSPLATMRQYAELTRTPSDAHSDAALAASGASAAPAASAEELADVVLSEGARMQDIVDGLLLLARLDEGAAHSSVAADVDLDDLALLEASRVRALGIAAVDATRIAPARMAGVERLLARAVRNLVDNAVRHARGTVALSTGVDQGYAILTVDDDGPGIPEADRERVFERFTRLDEARSRDAGGSGLGLAIVREIARSQRGDVRIDTSPLGGARFALYFPVVADDPASIAHPGPHAS